MKRSLETRINENDEDNSKSLEKSKMFIICREIFFVFTILFTAYATILNSQARTKRGSPAVPFFYNENIKDFYQGELKQLISDISETDFVFVMFYAPWDADCQDVKSEFIEAAEFYSNRIYFAAVNCWEPGSECKAFFKDVYHFPQLVAYIGHQKEVEYKGPHSADHIIKFLHSVLHPMHSINTVSDLWRLRYLHDAVLVGHLKFFGNKPGLGFRLLYDTSLRLASRDHERHTAVAVFSHTKVNSLLGVSSTPTFVLYLWNKKIEYNGPMKVDALVKWVLSRTEKGLAELNSNTLLPNMKGGAVMVMFTPRHPLSSVIPYYLMLRRIAMNFNICNNGTSTYPDEDFFSYVFQYGKFNKLGYEQDVINFDLKLREKCAKRKKIIKPKSFLASSKSCSAQISTNHWDNYTCYNSIPFCPNLKLNRWNERLTEQRYVWKQDQQSIDNIVRLAEEERCSILERTPLPLIPKPIFNTSQLPSSCDMNTTFSFIALDSEQYSHLANGLGIQLKKIKHRTTVVIIDDEEALKLDTAEVTEQSVTNLLKRYFAGERNRTLRSKRDSIYLHSVNKQRSNDPNSISIIELDTHSFHTVALNKSMNVAVLYHSPYCSFCLGVSNLFLTLSHLLRNIDDLLLVRLDGEMNDLPWQYTVHSYPSIIFFPARRKSESRVFPQTSPLTFHTLSNFILSNLQVYERISVLLALCSRWGDDPMTSEEGERCLRNVRSKSLDGISDTLLEYRRNLLRLKHCSSHKIEDNLLFQQRQLFRKIEYLKYAHLKLALVKSLQSTVINLEQYKNKIIFNNFNIQNGN
ncbi:hypothetical protein O3M35_012941 [Rhynocoris fuscipes]|uniref:Thioredoxin domain-containing protein n=1 Tax=Rhynocoris fuscipes TaxID=488301 RepID=A0AAW1CG32_9HEMI